MAVLDQIIQELHKQVAVSQHALRIHNKKHECETAYAHGRIYDVVQSLLEIANVMTDDLKHNKSIVDWLGRKSAGHIVELYIQSLPGSTE